VLPQDKVSQVKQSEHDLNVKKLAKQLEMLDERLDNMDSVVMSLVERVMGRPLIMEITCPKCGEVVQISVTSGVRLRGRE